MADMNVLYGRLLAADEARDAAALAVLAWQMYSQLATTAADLCPARAACLAGALERREHCGVWGGEFHLDGAIVPRKRPRGRPRRMDVSA